MADEQGTCGPQGRFQARTLGSVPENQGGVVKRLGDRMPVIATPTGEHVDPYVLWLPEGAGDDALRAAYLLRGIRLSAGPAYEPPASLRAIERMVGYRRITPDTLAAWLEMVDAPPHVHTDFLRLCPGVIAPKEG